MSRFRMWRPEKDEEYTFIDETILEMFEIGGTSVYLHKYLGPTSQGETNDATQPNHIAKEGNIRETQIQDLLFLENRDRSYDPNVYELTIVYNVQDVEFDLRQFGYFLENDILFFEIHQNDCVKKIGRKIMSGDVLEVPHLRDDLLLDETKPAVNKYYVVEDVNRAAGGYSPLWWPHILRIKVKPMTDSQEYQDILSRVDERSGQTLQDILSDFKDQIKISEALTEQARSDVDRRNFETAHFYVVPGEEDGKMYPWIFAGDGQPPNGAELSGSGTSFPDPNIETINEGDWFLHTGYEPAVLYRRENNTWKRKEVDWRKKWVAAHRILASYINNNTINDINGEKISEKQALSKVGLPKADF
jgi:hypothetical protein